MYKFILIHTCGSIYESSDELQINVSAINFAEISGEVFCQSSFEKGSERSTRSTIPSRN